MRANNGITNHSTTTAMGGFPWPGSASEISYQTAWRHEGNNRYGVQSEIPAVISVNKRVAAK